MEIVRYLRRKVSKYIGRGFRIFFWVYENVMYRNQRFVIPFAYQTGNASLLIDLFHPESNLIVSIPPIHLVI